MENVEALAGMCQPNTENCPRFKADEKKTFVTNSEMLEQVLRNQRVLLFALKGSLEVVAEKRIAETEALLDRID